MQKGYGKFNYMKLGHKSLRKLVCMKPGSRQPTVLAGGPDIKTKTNSDVNAFIGFHGKWKHQSHFSLEH
jgi:hypothetical protein